MSPFPSLGLGVLLRFRVRVSEKDMVIDICTYPVHVELWLELLLEFLDLVFVLPLRLCLDGVAVLVQVSVGP